jgi:hypothetical protein
MPPQGDASLATVFPDNHLLPGHALIGQLSASAARTAFRVAALFGMYPSLKKLFADGGYQGPGFHTALTKRLPQFD